MKRIPPALLPVPPWRWTAAHVRVASHLLGLCAWLLFAVFLVMMEMNGGEIRLHNNRIFAPFEAYLDWIATAAAIAVTGGALIMDWGGKR